MSKRDTERQRQTEKRSKESEKHTQTENSQAYSEMPVWRSADKYGQFSLFTTWVLSIEL